MSPLAKSVTKLMNFVLLVCEELEYVESSFEAAKRTLHQIGAQIAQLRPRLQSSFPKRDEIQKLRKEVRNLKYTIPYSLIYPSSKLSQITLTHDPNVVWHPRVSNPTARNTSDMTYTRSLQRVKRVKQDPDFYIPPPPHQHHTLPILLDECSSRIVGCFKYRTDFPFFFGQVLTKRTLLLNCFQAHSDEDDDSSRRFDSAINNLLTKGYIDTIYKTATSTVSSYCPKEFTDARIPQLSTIHFSPLPSEKKQVLYSDNHSIIKKMKILKVLLLGKWHRSLPHSQHIEVADPDLFYKGMEKLTELKFISLRGISMIPELPQFITKLKKLQFLDCNSCHELEVIPKNINKLWRTLTHLDISDCHLLDHMPPTLSDLIHLKVLKGFHVGESGQQRKSCTLRDLTKLSKLNKLHINTSIKGFPNTDQLTNLQKFPSLRNLGISWRACQTQEDGESTTAREDHQQQLSIHLEKLELQCVPNTVTRAWLNPVVFKDLKRLYITGGKFFDLGQIFDEPTDEYAPISLRENQWTVETLRLKHLNELKMEWSELHNLFPHLVNFVKLDCPNLTSCRNNNRIWVKSTHPHLEQILLNKEYLPDHDGIWLA